MMVGDWTEPKIDGDNADNDKSVKIKTTYIND